MLLVIFSNFETYWFFFLSVLRFCFMPKRHLKTMWWCSELWNLTSWEWTFANCPSIHVYYFERFIKFVTSGWTFGFYDASGKSTTFRQMRKNVRWPQAVILSRDIRVTSFTYYGTGGGHLAHQVNPGSRQSNLIDPIPPFLIWSH